MSKPIYGWASLCLYNVEISCSDHDKCDKCGWNPDVHETRKKETRKRIYVEMLRQKEERKWMSA